MKYLILLALVFAGCNPLAEDLKNSVLPISGGTAPSASNLSITVNEDQATAATGTITTSTAAGALTFAIASSPSKGTATINGSTGAYTYLPTAEQTGSDSFSVRISNSVGAVTVTVSVTITPYCTAYTQIAAAPFTTDFSPLPNGTAGREYRLCTKAQLDTVAATAALWNSRFKVYDDIDMNNGGANNGRIGSGVTYFRGVFDGRGKTISNFRYVVGAVNEVGFFGRVHGSAAEIKNFTLSNVTVTATGAHVGGAVGYLSAGAVLSGVRVTGAVSGGTYTGGLVGRSDNSIVGGSSSSAAVTSASVYVGGLAGGLSGVVTNSYATGAVNCTTQCGGLLGLSNALLFNDYATGNVTGTGTDIGGLIGEGNVNGSRLVNVFATGDVTGSSATATLGGLVGDNAGMAFVNSYRYSGAACNNGGGGGCNALGTAEAVLANFYTPASAPLSSWDFTNIWVNNAVTNTFPTLSPVFFNSNTWGTCATHQTDTPFAGGYGTVEFPYLICTAAQLVNLMTDNTYWDRGYMFKVMDNIDLSTTAAETRIGFSPNLFRGVFDGNGKIISNYTFATNNDATGTGFFGWASGILKRIALTNVNVTAGGTSTRVAGIVGTLSIAGSQVIDSYVTGSVTGGTGDYTAGIMGAIHSSSISNCYSTATITSSAAYVGGCIGFTSSNSCFATGDVTGNSATNHVGIGSGVNTSTSYYSTGATCTNLGGGGCHASGTGAAVNTFYSSLNAPLTGWDFNTVWQENAGTFPTLR